MKREAKRGRGRVRLWMLPEPLPELSAAHPARQALGGHANVWALIPTGHVTRQFHVVKISSRKRCKRITFGRSASSK